MYIFFLEYYEKGKVPVLLKGEEINVIDKEKLKKLVSKAFSKQYHDNEVEIFQQLEDNFI